MYNIPLIATHTEIIIIPTYYLFIYNSTEVLSAVVQYTI